MKKKGFCLKWRILLMLFCLAFAATPVMAAGSEAQAVAVSAKKAVKNGWKKESVGYCYYKNGKKVTNKFMTISGKKYYFGADGARKTGWYTVGNKSYYFDSKGVCKKSKKIDAALVKEMDRVIKSQKLTYKTKDNAALKKLFNYCQKSFSYKRVMGFKPVSGWEYTYAKQMLLQKKGSCYHDAAAFAFLAKRQTGLPVRICIGKSNAFNKNKWQPHAWVEVQAGKTIYTYDVNAARYSSLRKGKWCQQNRKNMEGKVYKTEKKYLINI